VNGEKRDIHRIVMEQRIGRPLKSNEVVHHINGNTFDNSIENLVIMDWSEHSKLHAEMNKIDGKAGLSSDNAKVRKRKLTPDQVREVRKLYAAGLSSRKIASRYDIDKSQILSIVHKETYRDIF
jgi:hypothetical protein